MTYDAHRARRDARETVQNFADSIPRTLVNVTDLAAAGESCRTCKHFRERILAPGRCQHKSKPVNHYNLCEYWKGK